MVIGRFCGSSTNLLCPLTGSVVSTPTIISFSSGRYWWTGAARSSLPSSTSIMAATLVTGFVIDAIQKIASGASGMVFARSPKPTARKYATLPLRVIAATAPVKAPASTCDCCHAAIRSSRDNEKLSASGSLTGVVSYARAAVARQSINSVAERRCRGFIGRPFPVRERADGAKGSASSATIGDCRSLGCVIVFSLKRGRLSLICNHGSCGHPCRSRRPHDKILSRLELREGIAKYLARQIAELTIERRAIEFEK